ncbi:glycoside hydrolase domain-containing protein [Streptomyces zingiberis]|uniref:DUF1906 domain-containing protein n=1 Tax=Streptomyces zingiberis TaxID=2053010 RepID=A0ABX1BRG2_9ACTN|nr:glycoside hydrolase domain-containing protein [Streptomyces zingiberis]NJP99164.1 DUF1906 domain-containing protein [Streptomyces zingiberis]
MERRTKIIQYLVAALTALASFIGGLFSAPATAAPSGRGTPSAGGPGAPGGSEGSGEGLLTRAAFGDPRGRGPEIFRETGFGTCRTPSPAAMNAWRKSHYRAIGVSFGGRGRLCKRQPNLNRNWALSVHRAGWGAPPLRVGAQVPCARSHHGRPVPLDGGPGRLRTEGAADGRDVVRGGPVLGFHPRGPLHLDVAPYEPDVAPYDLDVAAYDRGERRSAVTTPRSVRAWSREVHRRGHFPGFPGFRGGAESGMAPVERSRRDGGRDLPEVMWFARWGTRPPAGRDSALADGSWPPHRGIHRSTGDVRESPSGFPAQPDRGAVDAPVAVLV